MITRLQGVGQARAGDKRANGRPPPSALAVVRASGTTVALMELESDPSTSPGVRCMRKGNGSLVSVGRRMMAWSLTPSRIGIMTSCLL